MAQNMPPLPEDWTTEAGCKCLEGKILSVRSGAGRVIAKQCSRCGKYKPTEEVMTPKACKRCGGKRACFSSCTERRTAPQGQPEQ